MLRSVALWLRPAGWPLLPDAARRRTLLLAWAAILAQAVFLGGWVLAGALEPHYSAVRQYISELGREGAANPWIFMTFMAIWGLGFIALGVAVVPSLRRRPWPLAMPLFFVLAVVLLVAGIVTFFLHHSFAPDQGLEERLWALVAQLWALVCATVLILEATLEPGALRESRSKHREAD